MPVRRRAARTPARRALRDGERCDEAREDRRLLRRREMPPPPAARERAAPTLAQPLPVRRVPRRSRAHRPMRSRQAARALRDRTPRNMQMRRPQAATREEVRRARPAVAPARESCMPCAGVRGERRAEPHRSALRRRTVRRAARSPLLPEASAPMARTRNRTLRSRRCGDLCRTVAPRRGRQRETAPIRRANSRPPRAPSEGNRVKAWPQRRAFPRQRAQSARRAITQHARNG